MTRHLSILIPRDCPFRDGRAGCGCREFRGVEFQPRCPPDPFGQVLPVPRSGRGGPEGGSAPGHEGRRTRGPGRIPGHFPGRSGEKRVGAPDRIQGRGRHDAAPGFPPGADSIGKGDPAGLDRRGGRMGRALGLPAHRQTHATRPRKRYGLGGERDRCLCSRGVGQTIPGALSGSGSGDLVAPRHPGPDRIAADPGRTGRVLRRRFL